MKPDFRWLAGTVVFLLLSGACAPGQDFDVSRDYLSDSNPGTAWSYGWKPTLTGTFTLLTLHAVQNDSPGMAWEYWARAVGQPTSVYRNAGTQTLTSDGGAGEYPPGSVWFGPGAEPSGDHFGIIRFTARQPGRYRVGVAVQTRLNIGASDADFHVLVNTAELFGRNLLPVSSASFTNEVTLNVGDTIDFACGRGLDGTEYGGGLKIAAKILRLVEGVSIRTSQVQLCLETDTNHWYQLQYRSTLTTNQWVPLHSNFIKGTGTTFCTNDTAPLNEPRRFYQTLTTTNAPPGF